MESTSKKESERIIGKLRVAIRLLGFTNREIERRLEYTPSYLTRLFSGQIELRFEHVVDIARAMGLTADEFFAFAYPARHEPPSEAAEQLAALLEELKPSPPPLRPLPALPESTRDEREQMLMEFRKIHSEMRKMMDVALEKRAKNPRKRTT